MAGAVVPYTRDRLHEQTHQWAVKHGARLREIDPRDEAGYWKLLVDEWLTMPGDLVIVEHDMLPADGVVEEMEDCRRPWCTSPYQVTVYPTNIVRNGLGCVKFAQRLKDRHPDLMHRLGDVAGDGLPARSWRRLDARLTDLLHLLGYRSHTHRRSTHLHDYRNP